MVIKKNSAGRWIDSLTGRFVKKADYTEVLTKKEAANQSRSRKMKEYWDDVKKIQDLNKVDTKKARKTVSKSRKYIEKRGKKAYSCDDFWKQVSEDKLDKQARKKLIDEIEDEGFELTSD